ncbi:MAG: hypothetical protein NNA25_01510 [Nitrospira sp.]|nr:hypothetical protein [Nitrospira sp.]
MAVSPGNVEGLPDETRKLLQSYVEDVVNALGDGLEAVLLYGSAVRKDFLPGRSNLNVLLVTTSCELSVLKRYVPVHAKWNKEQIVVPLFLTAEELRVAAVVFPLEWWDIADSHRVLWGNDPFVGYDADSRYLAGEVLQGLRGNLVRLRQRAVEGGATGEAVTILLCLSITSLLPVLRGVQRLLNRSVAFEGESVLSDLEGCLEIDLAALREVWLLKKGHRTPGRHEVPRLLDRYLESLGRLAGTVERRVG